MKIKLFLAAALLAVSANASACLDYSDAWKWGLRGLSWDDLVGEPCSPITEQQLYLSWDEAFVLGFDFDGEE